MDTNVNLKDLYSNYEKAEAAVAEVKAQLDRALEARSEAVKAIAHAVAPSKQVVRNGKQLTIVVRDNNYFFRGSKNANAVEI